MSIEKKDIRSLSLQELSLALEKHNVAPFRAKQIHQWIWQKGVTRFDKMSNLSLQLRTILEENYECKLIQLVDQQISEDGTVKNSLKLVDQKSIECVLIPTQKRKTACISSQAGCGLNCKFCATAQIPKSRNLSVAEIVDQVHLLNNLSDKQYSKPLSNIVFMGMGEPLLNFANVQQAISIITNPKYLGMSPSRITVSTSGIPKMIKKMADGKPKFQLALSLHSAIQSTREMIMPFCSKFPLDELLDSLNYWYSKTNSQVTLEYIVWQGINDDENHINELIKFSRKVPSKVNLIEYNSIGSSEFIGASKSSIEAYQTALTQAKITHTIRYSRGKDIDAACGQLANKKSII